MKCDRNAMIPMRDGTRLATDIYTPDSGGPYPLIRERSPYNKENATMMWSHTHARAWIRCSHSGHAREICI